MTSFESLNTGEDVLELACCRTKDEALITWTTITMIVSGKESAYIITENDDISILLNRKEAEE